MSWITIALIIGLATATVALTAGAACLVASYVAHRVALVTTAQVIRAALTRPMASATRATPTAADQPNDPPTPSRSVN